MRKMRYPLVVLVMLVLSAPLRAQTAGDYRTDQNGNWGVATTWEVFNSGAWQKCENIAAGIYQNVTPTSASGAILIQNNTTVAASVSADQVTLSSGTLTVSAGQTLTINDGAGDDFTNLGGTVTVTGSLVVSPNVIYNHARNGGAIPLITWGTNSTCLVTGIANTAPALNNTATYEFFTWSCAGQSATISLAGNLRNVAKDLLIDETNNQQLRFATNQAYTLTIGGDFTVDNTSRIAFCTTASPVVVNTTGNFSYNSSAALGSLLKSSGAYTFTMNDFIQTAGLITASTGGGTGTFNILGNFDQSAGTINETGAGNGLLLFAGNAGLQTVSSAGTISGTINFQVNNVSVSGGIQLLSDLSIGGGLTQTAGDVNLNGQTLTINGNFAQASGNIVVDPSSQLVFQGTGTLPVGAVSFSGTDLLTLTVNQTGTLTTTSALQITNLNLYSGTLTATGITMADGGTIERRVGTLTNAASAAGTYNVVYNNTTAAVTTGPELPASTTELNNLTIQGGQTVNLASNITINGNLTTTAGVFAAAANSIDLKGNFISNAGFTTTAGGSFTVSGPASTLTGGASTPVFHDLFVTGSFSPTVNFQVNGNLDVSVGAALNASGGTASFAAPTATPGTITNSGTLTLNNFDLLTGCAINFPVTTVRVNGNFDVSTGTSVFNNGGGTVQFGGTTAITGTGTKTFNNVTVTGTVSTAGTVATRIDGTLNNTGTVNYSASTGSTTFGGTTPSLTGSGTTQFGPVVVLSGATLTTSSVFSMTTLNINNTGTPGVLNANADFSMTGNFTGTGNFTSTATVTFAGGTTSMTGAGSKVFNNIVVNNGAIFSPTVNHQVNGNITVNPTGSLADPNNTHTVTFNGAPSTISGGGSIIFDGVTINAGQSVVANTNITIDNAFTDGSAASSFTSTATVTFTGVTMTGTGTKSFTNVTVGTGTFTPNANYTINGNLVVNGTLSNGTANAVTTFGGTSVISGAGTIDFPFLTITGTLTSSTGIITVERDFTNNGTFNHNNGTVSFITTGTVQQQILGSQSITFNNLTINNVGVATDVTNGNAGTVSIVGTLGFGEANAVLDADGAGGGTLVLVSSADDPALDGRIGTIPAATSNVSGNFTVQRYVSSENRIYRYIASPVIGATVAQLKAAIPVTGTFTDPSDGSSTPPCTGCNTTNPSLFYYDEATQGYVAFPASGLASAATFTNGRGYSAFFRHTGLGAVGTVVINFRGTNPSPAGVALPVAAAAGNYSLIGNPYPSAINWANAAGWSARTGFSNIAVVRDNATGVHQFLDLNSASPQLIAPGQSFWVQTLVAATPLTVNENAKATGTYSFYRLDQAIEDILEFNLTKSTTGTTDNARIVLRSGSTNLYDMYDAFKFNNNIDNGSTITEVQDISTLTVEATPKALAVNAIPSINCTQTFNIRTTNLINTGETVVNYTLTINPTGAMKSMTWTLHDNYTGSDIPLNSTGGVYNFSVDNSITASKSSARFTITANAPTIDVAKTVSAAPVACGGSDAMITLAASQANIAYGVEVNGTYYPNVVTGNGSDLSIFIDQDKLQSGSNTISVKANSGCQVLAVGSPVQVEMAPVYQAAASSPPALCAPGTFSLTASGAPNDGTYHWYDSPVSPSILSIGANYAPEVTSSRSFYVAAVNAAGCEGQRVEVVTAVGDTTATVEIAQSATIVCKNETMKFTATSSTGDGQFFWYDSADPQAPPVATTASNEEVPFTIGKTMNYYVRYSPVPGCVREPIQVAAATYTFTPTLTTQFAKAEVCKGQGHTITVSGAPAGSTYQWFDSDGVSPLVGDMTFNTGALTTTKTFYVTAISPEGCASAPFGVPAMVDDSNPSTTFTYALDGGASSLCQDSESAVTITNPQPGLTYRWFESPTSMESIHEGNNLPSRSFSGPTSFYVSAVNANGCETTVASRRKVDVAVTNFQEPVIDAPFYGVLKSSYDNNQWYKDGEMLSGETAQSIRIFDPGYYSVRIDQQGCEAWSNIIFATDLITGIQDESRVIRLFPNPVSEKLTVHALGNDPVSGQLLDQQGRVIANLQMMPGDGEWNGELDVRSMARGMYLLRLSSGNKSVTHKIIIR